MHDFCGQWQELYMNISRSLTERSYKWLQPVSMAERFATVYKCVTSANCDVYGALQISVLVRCKLYFVEVITIKQYTGVFFFFFNYQMNFSEVVVQAPALVEVWRSLWYPQKMNICHSSFLDFPQIYLAFIVSIGVYSVLHHSFAPFFDVSQ